MAEVLLPPTTLRQEARTTGAETADKRGQEMDSIHCVHSRSSAVSSPFLPTRER